DRTWTGATSAAAWRARPRASRRGTWTRRASAGSGATGTTRSPERARDRDRDTPRGRGLPIQRGRAPGRVAAGRVAEAVRAGRDVRGPDHRPPERRSPQLAVLRVGRPRAAHGTRAASQEQARPRGEPALAD